MDILAPIKHSTMDQWQLGAGVEGSEAVVRPAGTPLIEAIDQLKAGYATIDLVTPRIPICSTVLHAFAAPGLHTPRFPLTPTGSALVNGKCGSF
jgi:hypothetical protein